MARYILLVQLSIPAELEALFNDLYDNEHIPNVLAIPGVTSCTRFKLEWGDQGMADYMAIWEVDDPDLPKTETWKIASDKGAWRMHIRPHLRIRMHGMYKMLNQPPC